MAQHTPGEWTLLDDDRSIIVGGGPNNDDIAEFFFRDTTSVSISREEAVANAVLFRSAPALLDDGRQLADAIAKLVPSDAALPHASVEWKRVHAALAQFRITISKASI